MPRSLQILTLGCSKNRVDSEHLLALLDGRYRILPEESGEKVDVLLINSCGFIADAKQESIDCILTQAERKKRGEVGQIGVFGCLSQRYEGDLPALIPEVDAWFGARDFKPLLSWLGVNDSFEKAGRVLTTPSHYAYLKISEGCDRRCSYCAIPFIRGAHRSVPIERLVSEATGLASRGVKELLIVAQDSTYYGLDLYHRRALGELLRELSKIDGIEWLRIHYSYPDDFPEDVIREMATNPKVCPYMDIPLQHISDKVLTNMRRGVTGEWTRRLIRTMREKVPGLVLRTTLIVGHPGEGEPEFAELLDFIREARFERLGAFTYSEEEGTYAARYLKDEVPAEEKQRRYDELMRVQSAISLSYNQSRVGSLETVLVDDFRDGVLVCRSRGESPEVDGEILVGVSDSPLLKNLDPYCLVGEMIRVRIVGAGEYDLIAEAVEI
ncbi:MAG: 30S ribosomal protein S12 methylthiotransferase RimO [Bacteroidales bacterium]|nr:30S ribosomal protein S12 methylthiotransferase RimO [Bacteroidales bacterium]